jgi:AhpD family alkylhydroperoxidase
MKFEDFAAKRMLESTHEDDYLTDREKQLIGLAVSATRGCIACSGSRIKRALESGIPWEALIIVPATNRSNPDLEGKLLKGRVFIFHFFMGKLLKGRVSIFHFFMKNGDAALSESHLAVVM